MGTLCKILGIKNSHIAALAGVSRQAASQGSPRTDLIRNELIEAAKEDPDSVAKVKAAAEELDAFLKGCPSAQTP